MLQTLERRRWATGGVGKGLRVTERDPGHCEKAEEKSWEAGLRSPIASEPQLLCRGSADTDLSGDMYLSMNVPARDGAAQVDIHTS